MKRPLEKPDARTSYRMKHVATSDTSIEKKVRHVLYKLGFRFRLNIEDLPGKPDIVLKKHHTVIFVHGCFWHGHTKCRKGQQMPKKNLEYWHDKITKNKKRDKKAHDKLTELGWRVLVIWECKLPKVEGIIRRFLGNC